MRKKGRRTNNSGNFNWRKNKLYIYMSEPKFKGDRSRKLIGIARTLSEGEDIVLKYKRDNGIIVSSAEAKKTVEEFLEDWLIKCQGKQALTTLAHYRHNIETNIVPYIGEIKLHMLKSDDINNMTAKLYNRGLSKNTISLVVTILNTALNYAIDCDWITKNVVKKAKKLKADPRKKIIPNREQCADLIKEFMKEKDYKIPLLFCLLLGLRRGEALAVKWEDIDFNSNYLKVNKQVVYEEGCTVIRKPKTNSSIRNILMPQTLKEELMKVPKNDRFGYVVKSSKRKLYTFYRCFARICKRLNLKNITLHSLRHANSSYLLNGGASLDSVSRHLGHSSIRVTGDIYAHEIHGTQEKEAAIIDNLVIDSLSDVE